MIGIEAEILNLIRKTYNSLARWNVKEYLTAGSDTFVVPTGVREVYVTLQGGGGGGAGSVGSGSETYGSMGGGSGSLVYRWKFKIPHFLSSFSVNIGEGGEGGVASGGSDGGTSYIGSYWIGARGGLGGQANGVVKSGAGLPGFPYLTTLQKESKIAGPYLGWGNYYDFDPKDDSNGENCKFYATRDANNPSGGWWYGSPFDDGCWIIVGASAGGRHHGTKSGDGGGSVMGGYSGGAGSSDTVGNTYLPGSGGGASCFGAGGAGGVGTGDPTDGGGYGAGGGAASTALSPGTDKTGANGIAGFVRIEWVGVPYGS